MSTMRSVAALIESALEGEEDDERAWEAIRALHHLGDASVFEAASALVGSQSAKERGRGVDILGQFGGPLASEAVRARCATVVLAALATEQSPEVLHAIGVALGHLRDARAVEALTPLRAHKEAKVRLGVVLGLTPHAALDALIALSADPDDEVRNWATFGLGSQATSDTPALRDALVARLEDAHAEVRGEALVGLAERKDPRVLEALRRELQGPNVSGLAVGAAEALGDVSLLPLVLPLRRPGGDRSFNALVAEAIAALERAARKSARPRSH